MKCLTYSDASSGKTATLRAVTCTYDFAQINHPSNSPVNFQCYCINKPHKFFHSLNSFLLPVTYSCLVAHRAFTEVFHFSCSSAISSLPFVKLTLPLFVPFSTVLLRVFLDVPLLPFLSVAQLIAMLQSLYGRM